MNGPGPSSASWQVILADLSLILFVTTLAALAATRSRDEAAAGRDEPQGTATLAEGQSLFRRRENGGSLQEWLDEQIHDPRERLTIFARYRPASREEVWQEAARMEREAASAGYTPRLVLEAASQNDVVASLAFDDVPAPDER